MTPTQPMRGSVHMTTVLYGVYKQLQVISSTMTRVSARISTALDALAKRKLSSFAEAQGISEKFLRRI